MPQRAGTPEPTRITTASATHAVGLPSGIVSGEGLIAWASVNNGAGNSGAISAPTGWSEVFQTDDLDTTSETILACFRRIADGTEGATQNFTLANAQVGTWSVERIQDHNMSTDDAEAATPVEVENDTDYDPPSITPSTGSDDYLIMAGAGWWHTPAVDTWPANYDDPGEENAGIDSNGGGLAVTTREVTSATTENPAAIVLDGSTWGWAGTIAIQDGSEGAPGQAVTDGIELGDTAAGQVISGRSVSDGLVLGDSVGVVAAFPRALTDGVLLGDSALAQSAVSRSLSDGLVLGEGISTTWTTDSGPDGVQLGDSVAQSASSVRSVSDGLVLGDAVVAAAGAPRSITDGLLLGEDIDTVWTVDSGPDGVVVGDSAVAGSAFAAALTDGILLGDSGAAVSMQPRSITDGIVLGDAVGRVVAYSAAATDGVELGDGATAGNAFVAAVSDGLVLGDAVVGQGQGERSVSDGLSLGDAAGSVASFLVSVADGLLLGDAASSTPAHLRSAADGILLGDSAASGPNRGPPLENIVEVTHRNWIVEI